MLGWDENIYNHITLKVPNHKNASEPYFLINPFGMRFDEMTARGESPDFESLLAAEQERDRRDSERATAPLRQAPDAVLIDSSSLSIDAVESSPICGARRRCCAC